ncbi:ATP-dependent protease [Thermococcus sp. GR7]|uniref:S16 family serine protease n=1 Tax=unclassified Thermococcus TaxID=2627626 RepID=UPI001431916B|nr:MULTISPECIES: S16 family serine protease [unclassified Thermococcus]NJE46714.1 ATP-dependent protease [Thermococcus sp. GR7]NJE77858.1 ATP-dependent protease [Thermococcus sp. GR4]NJF22986.1 ATP-dependent protease [Thermococcus sp. GR5]
MKKAVVSLLILMLLLPFASFTAAQCPSEGHTVVLKAPAVSRTAEGELVGVATDFVITVAPGSGHVYVETWPLAEVDMQASARLAAQIAGKVLGVDMSKYDVFIQIKADSPIIGGPSAGGTMTVGIIAALEGWQVNPKVMMTGMINPDGTIGPVGGILEKAAAAHDVGAEVFLIPQGQRIQYVEETQKREIGGIVEINTQTKKVDVVEYAKERWGLQVIEIKDIYDAVYYFTGHRIPRPEAPAYVKIDTSFLRDDALKDYQNTTAYYQETLEKLKKSDVNYAMYTTLREALNKADGILNQSKSALDDGRYYTTLSKDFQARIIIRHVDWYLGVEGPEDVQKILKTVESQINASEKIVSNITIRGTTMLQAVAAAEERVEQAKSILDEAWKYYYSNDYWNAVGDAAFAYERAKTAIFWARLGERFAGGDVISSEVVKAVARDYIDESNLIVTYIESMYGTVGGDLSQSIVQAEQYYEDGKYSAALFTAMEARVQAQVFLDTLGIDNQTVLLDKLKRMKEDAKVAIALAQSQGITPVLAMAYYEFAESYEENGSPEDIQTAMIFYMYAKETAGLFLSTLPTPVNVLQDNTTGIPQIVIPTSTDSKTATNSATSTSKALSDGLIIALLVGSFIVGAAVGKKL